MRSHLNNHDFAFDACVSGLCLAVLGAAFVAGCRSSPDARQERFMDNKSKVLETPEDDGVGVVKAAAPAAPRADSEMQLVLDELAKLGGKRIETLDAESAREQPTPADAVAKLVASGRVAKPAQSDVRVTDESIAGPAGPIEARVYAPQGNGPFPVIVYYHGGGWVIADLDTYDASARALCSGANAIVVASHYRQAPEHRFPAAHDDAFAAYKWTLENASAFRGDPSRVAVAGESAGGNLAAAVCLMARDAKIAQPKHQLLVYPVTSTSLDWPSVEENARAKPLNKAMLPWFIEQYAPSASSKEDPRLDLLSADLKGLPPATLITARIDPLHSQAVAFAEKLGTAGVSVDHRDYAGVTHEFFGMDAALSQAREAQAYACERLKRALGVGANVEDSVDARRGEALDAANERADAETRAADEPR